VTKTIIHDKQILFLVLVVAFFVGASITDVFFDYDAEAKKTPEPIEVGDEIPLKGKGTGTCTSGDNSGTAKANVRFLLKVDEVDDDNISGVAKAQMKFQSDCEGVPKELVSNGPLAFTLSICQRIITMSGDLEARDSTKYTFDAIGQVNEGKKTTIDMSFVVHEIPTGITLEIPIRGFVLWDVGCNDG
jgi:hypothetical protein